MPPAIAEESPWYRHSRYVVDSEADIRPAPKATFQTYSPWSDFRERQRLDEAPPYATLVELATRIDDARPKVIESLPSLPATFV